MPALAFTDQRERLRRIVENALEGCTYDSSREEEGRLLLVEARRQADGARVYLRFRGVERSEATADPAPGSAIRLGGVGAPRGSGILDFVIPFRRLFRPRSNALRVSLAVGSARIEVFCEDAEWWEETAPPLPANGTDA